MKKHLFLIAVGIILLGFAGFAWAQCPEDPVDLGYCDTLHVVPWAWTDTCYVYGGDTICVNDPGTVFPCLFYVSLLVTHDSNSFWWEGGEHWVQDSLAGFTVPLTWAHTNPATSCILPTNLNDGWSVDSYMSIWRDFAGMENRIKLLNDWCSMPPCWGTYADISNDDPYHAYLYAVATNPIAQRWWEGERTLFATLTFKVEDTTTVCMDTTFWPPSDHLAFLRQDAALYCPRDNMPLCFTVFETGDVNANATVDVGDQVYLYNYLFIGGPAPVPYEAGDLTQDGIVDVGDLTYMINYLFIRGPLPPVAVVSSVGN